MRNVLAFSHQDLFNVALANARCFSLGKTVPVLFQLPISPVQKLPVSANAASKTRVFHRSKPCSFRFEMYRTLLGLTVPGYSRLTTHTDTAGIVFRQSASSACSGGRLDARAAAITFVFNTCKICEDRMDSAKADAGGNVSECMSCVQMETTLLPFWVFIHTTIHCSSRSNRWKLFHFSRVCLFFWCKKNSLSVARPLLLSVRKGHAL